MNRITIQSFKAVNKGKIRGNFDLQLGALVIRGCTLYQHPERRSIGFPFRIAKKFNGENETVKLVEIPDKQAFQRIEAEILEAIDTYLSNQKPSGNRRGGSGFQWGEGYRFQAQEGRDRKKGKCPF